MEIDPQGWVVGTFRRHATKRTVPMLGGVPRAVLWHWTAGYGSSRTLARLYEQPQSSVVSGPSFHLGIDRDGSTAQLAPFSVGTRHVRDSLRWRGGIRVSQSSIGVELVNVGRVMQVGDTWYQVDNPQDPAEAHRPNRAVHVVPSDVVAAHGGHWQGYTPRQIETARALVVALKGRYLFDDDAIRNGHCDVDPARKADPGPLWMHDAMRVILGRGGVA